MRNEMRLTRNQTPDGKCKYAIVRLDRIRSAGKMFRTLALGCLDQLVSMGLLEYGEKGSREEFFVIKLKDRFAGAALLGYADQVEFIADAFNHAGNPDAGQALSEYALEVRELMARSFIRDDRRIPDTNTLATAIATIEPQAEPIRGPKLRERDGAGRPEHTLEEKPEIEREEPEKQLDPRPLLSPGSWIIDYKQDGSLKAMRICPVCHGDFELDNVAKSTDVVVCRSCKSPVNEPHKKAGEITHPGGEFSAGNVRTISQVALERSVKPPLEINLEDKIQVTDPDKNPKIGGEA